MSRWAGDKIVIPRPNGDAIPDLTEDAPSPLLTEGELAHYLGVSACTVSRWRLAGKIPVFHLPVGRGEKSTMIRYRLEDVNNWLRNYRR